MAAAIEFRKQEHNPRIMDHHTIVADTSKRGKLRKKHRETKQYSKEVQGVNAVQTRECIEEAPPIILRRITPPFSTLRPKFLHEQKSPKLDGIPPVVQAVLEAPTAETAAYDKAILANDTAPLADQRGKWWWPF